MNKLFSEFPKVSKEEWEEKLKKELKGADFTSSLTRNDEIEELVFPTYTHESDKTKSIEIPGEIPFTRGFSTKNNDWNIAATITVFDEKEANLKALDLLMTGCNSLVFDFQNEKVDLSVLFESIGFEYIETHFKFTSFELFSKIHTYFLDKPSAHILYRLDFLNTSLKKEFTQFATELKNTIVRFCWIDAFSFQQCGATILQEISFALASGHEQLVDLMKNGYSIDQAAASIHFSFGVGSTYFYEVAKIRAFRKLWNQIVQAYKPIDSNAVICPIMAEIGWTNKSLKDPYTNLLRQTTELMSVVSGGIQTALVHPYDEKSTQGSSELAARMAINCSLILKEESYFDKVIDPFGGSYSIEQLTEQIAEKAWKKFQEIEKNGGITAEKSIQLIQNEVKTKIDLKLEKIKSGKQVMIGINKFPNPQVETNSWLPTTSFFGLEQCIFENEFIKS